MSFFDSVFAGQDRDRRDRSVHGVAIAKVTGRMGDGTYELKYLGMGGDTPSAPARMMMPNAGNKRGMYWMPEVGDEVVVAFEADDPNAPIVLGALYNADSATPDQAQPSNDNNVRTIVSRSGHEVTLDDSPGAGKVTVKTKDGRGLTLDDTPPGKIELSTPSGISIKLDDATGTLTLSAPTAIVLESASLSLLVSGIMSVTATAAMALTAGTITLTGLVMVDGKPFLLHTHSVPPAPPGPIVTP
jgi:uncharacterized protein involved in type VI secretion and phage assembly